MEDKEAKDSFLLDISSIVPKYHHLSEPRWEHVHKSLSLNPKSLSPGK